MMKRQLCIMLFTFSLFLCLSASADRYFFDPIIRSDGFYYTDQDDSNWTFCQSIRETVEWPSRYKAINPSDDDLNIEFLFLIWGNTTELTCFPELRVFIDRAFTALVPDKVVFIIDGNPFSITFEELLLENAKGGRFFITSKADIFITALAEAKNVDVRIHIGSSSHKYTINDDGVTTMNAFAREAQSIHYLSHLSSSCMRSEDYYVERTPIYYTINNQEPFTSPDPQTTGDPLEYDSIIYSLDDLGMSVSIPNDYIVYTRGMSADDPSLIAIGLSPEQMDEFLIEQNIYLDCINYISGSEFYISMYSSPVESIHQYDDAILSSLASQYVSYYEQAGSVVTKSDIYRNGGLAFLAFHGYTNNNGASPSYKIQYVTVNDYQSISITYTSTFDEITTDEELMLIHVIDSISFNSLQSTAINQSSNSSGSVNQPRKFTLEAGPLSITLDETKYTILVPNMQNTDPAIKRSGLPNTEAVNVYLEASNTALMLFDINDRIPAKWVVNIKIKDRKYPGSDVRSEIAQGVTDQLDLLRAGFDTAGAYEIETVLVKGVPYLRFKWFDGTQLRYATVINGDMIYIWIERPDDQITSDDAALLLSVVEAIQYPQLP